jgi:hypothetical protein
VGEGMGKEGCEGGRGGTQLGGDEETSSSSSSSSPFGKFQSAFEAYKKKVIMDDVGVEEFVSFDNAVACEDQLTFEDCVEIGKEYVKRWNSRRVHKKKKKDANEIKTKERPDVAEKNEKKETDDGRGASGKVTGKEVQQGLRVLKSLFSQKGVGAQEMKALQQIQRTAQQLATGTLVQSTLSNYFVKRGKNDQQNEQKENDMSNGAGEE